MDLDAFEALLGAIGAISVGAIVAHKELAHVLKTAKGVIKFGGA